MLWAVCLSKAYILFILSLLFGTATLTYCVKSYALRHLLDIPNDRSSHSVATPRGGGVAIVVAVLVAVCLMYSTANLSVPLAGALLWGGLLVASIGFIDDHRPVIAPVRLFVHFLAVVWCVWLLGPIPPINVGFGSWNLGIFGTSIAIVFLVWFLNLVNFMDGIDGLAAVEVISVSAIAALLLASRSGYTTVFWLLVAISSAVGGFLTLNWPPAKIFMGDAGSGFLGFVLGAVAWASIAFGQLSVWVWLILVGTFVCDASVTLFRRWRRGEKIQMAHRSHAYQRLSRRLGSHVKVTLGYLAVNLLWLSPLAFVAVRWPSYGAPLTLLAWIPLGFIAWHLGAGLPDNKKNDFVPFRV